MSSFDDDLFEDEKYQSRLGSRQSEQTVADDDDFYEKLGGSIYGGSSSESTARTNHIRFKEPERLNTYYEYPESSNMSYTGIEYPKSTYNRYSRVSLPGSTLPDPTSPSLGPHNTALRYLNLMMPGDIETNDYNVNLLEEATGMDDPFGDDDSLFSETGEEPLRRSNTTRGIIDGDEDDFRPRLNYTKTIKRAKLVGGNYVIDAPAPKVLLSNYGLNTLGDSNETAFVRYSGVTCGPSNFGKFNYNLRQTLYYPPRETEIMVCITMYNEDELLLGRTLEGVFANIRNLTNRTDPTWGDGSWKKIVVVIINDGRLQLHERTQKLLAALGVYQEGYAKSKVNDKVVKSHVYEYTTTVGIEKVSNDRVHLNTNLVPVQLLFCLKEKNARKINSHRWCLQAFASTLNPKVIMLLDCGTKPSKDAFYHLWNSFKDPNVAGACGEMRCGLGPGNKLLFNPLVAAQNFEYKISNVLDKPMESVFGFISVLPGAFSAYRWDALLNVDGTGPLEKYFKGEFLHQETQIDEEDDEAELKEKNFQESGIFTSNMYLAEDRILCFELVAKKGQKYVLRYVSGAKAETDVPEHIDDFVLQRRRWLNGSLFAAVYSIIHWTQIWRSDHTLLRKLWLQFEFYYHSLTLLVSWFSLASFFLVFRILTKNLGSGTVGFGLGKYLAVIFLWIYVACLICTFVLAFGNTPRGTRKFYFTITVLFAVMMIYLTFAAVYLAVRTVQLVMKSSDNHFKVSMLFTNEKFRDLVVSMLSTYLLYTFGAILHGEPSFMFTSFLQYLMLSPSYINVLNIYSFCNIHDISWGNRDVPQARDLGVAKISDKSGELVISVAPASNQELEQGYNEVLEDLRTPPPQLAIVPNKKQQDASYHALVRTITVLLWMLTNGILVAVVLATGGGTDSTWNSDRNSTVFLTVILWVVCGLAAFRLFGSLIYVLQKIGRPMKWWVQKRTTVE